MGSSKCFALNYECVGFHSFSFWALDGVKCFSLDISSAMAFLLSGVRSVYQYLLVELKFFSRNPERNLVRLLKVKSLRKKLPMS